AQSQFPVDGYCIQNFVIVELLFHHFDFSIEFFGIVLGPPVIQIAVCIVLATLIVKTMSHFMTDYSTDSSVIYSIISIWIVKWKLENTGWKNDFIETRIVICIHGLRRHHPFGFVNRLTKFIDFVLIVDRIQF